jgi:hypothetical protein
MLVFEAHPSSTQIRCTICDQETGIHKWISRPSARHHLDSQQHQNALNSVQQQLAAQQHDQQTTAAETHPTFHLKALDPNTVSQSELHHEARMRPPMYELTDLYLDLNGEEIVLTAGEETLTASMALGHGVSLEDADSEYFLTSDNLGWDILEGDSVDDTITNVSDILTSLGEYLLYCHLCESCLLFILVHQDWKMQDMCLKVAFMDLGVGLVSRTGLHIQIKQCVVCLGFTCLYFHLAHAPHSRLPSDVPP